ANVRATRRSNVSTTHASGRRNWARSRSEPRGCVPGGVRTHRGERLAAKHPGNLRQDRPRFHGDSSRTPETTRTRRSDSPWSWATYARRQSRTLVRWEPLPSASALGMTLGWVVSLAGSPGAIILAR